MECYTTTVANSLFSSLKHTNKHYLNIVTWQANICLHYILGRKTLLMLLIYMPYQKKSFTIFNRFPRLKRNGFLGFWLSHRKKVIHLRVLRKKICTWVELKKWVILWLFINIKHVIALQTLIASRLEIKLVDDVLDSLLERLQKVYS